ncbi:probable root meristem growth factor 8 isoform X2 [Pistacia vera]|uniref:probable root meristem growth factor 8 isoform X2 n=1 Tax=Pistacia vera TaxID=55513 RepID=UPI00126335B1|nr:probable root meristem growth factor 8 isoform X2 [Pistacia vera]
MELIVITLFFIISLSLIFQAPCASSLHIQVQSSHEKAIEIQLSDLPTLPRKLRVTAEVTVKQHGGPETMSRNNQESEPVQAGKKTYNKEKGEMHGGKGTRQEWVEGTDTSQYFTMDYSHVKRRRPIHNKSLPVGP